MENRQESRRKKNPDDLRRKILLRNFHRKQTSNLSNQRSVVDRESLNPVIIESSSEDMDVDIESNSDCEDKVEIASSSQNSQAIDDQKKCKNSRPKGTLNVSFSQFTATKVLRLQPKQKSVLSNETIDEIANIESTESSPGSSKDIPLFNFEDESEIELPHELVNKLKDKLKTPQKKRGIVKAKHGLRSKSVAIDKTHKSYFKHLKQRVKRCFSKVQDVLVNRNSLDSKCAIAEKNQEKLEINDESSESNVQNVNSPTTKLKQFSNLINDNSFLSRQSTVDNKLCQNFDANLSHITTPQSSRSLQSISGNLNDPKEEIRKLELTNKRLREENRLLSESLSSIMADVDKVFKYYTTRSHLPDDPLKENINHSSQNVHNRNYLEHEHKDSQSPKHATSRVLRSSSLQEQTKRKNIIRQHLSSQSMSHRQYARFPHPQRALYRAKPCIITPCPSPREYSLIKPELPPILPPKSNKTLNRRSSMPEQVNKKPMVLRRSNCAQNNITSCSLPKEFPLNKQEFPSVLPTNSNKGLNRRSSMPERITERPLLVRRPSCVHDSPLTRSRRSLLSLPLDAFY